MAGGLPGGLRVSAWVLVTMTAALFQTWRTALQQKLRGELSVSGAGFVRFLYGAPVAAALFALALAITGAAVPVASARFVAFCAVGGLCQILATNLLIAAFGYRNFAVGTAYAKTEAAQAAILAWAFIDERLTGGGVIGIALGLAGVLTLSLAGRGGVRAVSAVVQPAALCGLGAGFGFALTAIFIKLGNNAIAGPVVVRALMGVCVTNTLQTAMQGAYLAWREPQQLRRAVTTWRVSALAGVLSACGSACWFTAFVLAPVALVRAVGQVEMVFTFAFSRWYLGERLRASDAIGLVAIVAGVVVIVLV